MNREQLIEDLIRDEGRKNKPYLCTEGRTTIGVGRNLSDRGLSDTEIDILLGNDIDDCLIDLNNTFPWFSRIKEPWQRGLVNLRFCLGQRGVEKFVKMLAALEALDGEEAALQVLDSKFARQTGKRSARIAALYRQ